MVTSCKGGVGKTTLTAGISTALAKMGKTVLTVDMDFGVRSLDLALGFENNICADAYDAITERCELDKTYISSPDCPNLFFTPAPAGFDNRTMDSILKEQINKYLSALKEKFDYIFLDMPAGFGKMFELVASSPVTDKAVIICSHSPSSVRAAEKTAFELYKFGKTPLGLVINMFNIPFVKKGYYPGILDIIERSSVKLMGVVPDDTVIDSIQQRGGLINCEELHSRGNTAIKNIARRINGENVSLMQSIVKTSKRSQLL